MKKEIGLYKTLGLDKKEIDILKTLASKSQIFSAQEIQNITKVPRATLDRTLEKLHKRGLLDRHEYTNKRGGYKHKDLQNVFSGQGYHLSERDSISNKTLQTKTFYTLKDIEEEIRLFIERNKNKKVFSIQNKKVWESWRTSLGEQKLSEITKKADGE